ncbi:hypothetical protein ADUPG1_005512, partial [Aduncisulcus paluster]
LDATGRCTKALCTPVCGANGTCVIVDGSPECSCNDPDHWTGSTCEIPMCPDSSDGFCGGFGTCKGDPDTADNVPYCDCFDGFTTDDYGDCTVPSCSPLCENDGICVTTSGDGTDTKCVCGDYYSGADCTEELCSNMPKGNGACIDGSPVCYYGWTGDDCDEPVCSLQCAPGNGECVFVDDLPACECYSGWTGIGCDIPTCNSDTDCGYGSCVISEDDDVTHVCECYHGYQVDITTGKCTDARCNPDCYQGYCVVSNEIPECVCTNPDHWGGATCEEPLCPDSPSGCGVYGECVEITSGDDIGLTACECDDGWELDETTMICSVPTCSSECLF